MSSTCNVAKLAEETLLLIFDILCKSLCAQSMLAVVLTCRKWNRVGHGLLYRDVRIRNDDLQAFARSLQKYGHLVQALSLQLNAKNVEWYRPESGPNAGFTIPVEDTYLLKEYGSRTTQELWRNLEEFSAKLPTMKNLSIFSICVGRELEKQGRVGFFIHRRCIYAILEAITGSLMSLEIDIDMLEQFNDRSGIHLCPQFNRLLLQLTHLRLRLPSICKALLQSFRVDGLAAPFLKIFIINTGDSRRYTVECKAPGTTSPRYPLVGSDEHDYDWPLACAEMLEKGDTPGLQQFDIINNERDDSWDIDSDEDIEEREDGLDFTALHADHLIQYDVLRRKIFSLPIKSVGNGARSIMLRSRHRGEFFGDIETLTLKVEGPAWVETVGGVRFPAEFATSKQARSLEYAWQDLDIDEREGFMQRSSATLEIWEKEGTDGVWMLDAEEIDHL